MVRYIFEGARAADARRRRVSPPARFSAHRQRAPQRQELLAGEAEACELGDVRLGPIEGRDDDRVEVGARGVGDGAHRQPEEDTALLPVEDGDRLEAQLFQRHVRELGGLAHAVENDPLGSVSGEMAERLTKRLTRPAVDPEGVAHVVVGEPALLEQPLRRQDVAQALPGVGLPRKLGDLDEALLGEALHVEVRQAQRDSETLRQRALREGAPFADGGEDLEVSLAITFPMTLCSIFEQLDAAGQLNSAAVPEGRARRSPSSRTNRTSRPRTSASRARSHPRPSRTTSRSWKTTPHSLPTTGRIPSRLVGAP